MLVTMTNITKLISLTGIYIENIQCGDELKRRNVATPVHSMGIVRREGKLNTNSISTGLIGVVR